MSHKPVRVRFAPSPTGPLHIGGVRTALFNFLFARKHGGKFLLRIEDTDSQRFVEGAEEYIYEALDWCGITVDEGVRQGGPHWPYRQSERKHIYRQYAEQLVSTGNAYYAFDSPSELERLRGEAEAKGMLFTYNHSIRDTMCNSLNLPTNEVMMRIERGDQWVIRFRMPKDENVVMEDLIRGTVTVNTSTLDDKVLFKSSDQLPTYHLANVTDYYLMAISHVIRGEEWLPSLPLHVLLYRALGWTDSMPQFAHLPLLLKPTGKGKLSKRDGDAMGFPVFPLKWVSPQGEVCRGYREDGYIPHAFVNMLALLGWNPGTEQEILSLDELIGLFSLERVSKSGAQFDPDKAKWFNHQYLVQQPDEILAGEYEPFLREKGVNVPLSTAARVVGLVKERVNFTHELWEQSSFFFVAPTQYDDSARSKHWKPESASIMLEVKAFMEGVTQFESASIDAGLKALIAEKGYGMGKVMNALRICLVGESKGPGLADICEIIGRGETIRRIEAAVAALK